MNKAYMDAAAWDKYAGAAGAQKPTTDQAAPSGTTLDLAVAVMQGKYGVDQARKDALGTRYKEVQDFINHIASASTDTLVKETMQGKYGNGKTREIVLGSKYKAVQDKINGSGADTIRALETPCLVLLQNMELHTKGLRSLMALRIQTRFMQGRNSG